MFRNGLEPWHIVVIVVVVALLFGWKRMPDAARSVGRSMRIFKSEVSEMKNDSRPSAAASDTVRGNVVHNPAGQPSQSGQSPYGPPQYATPTEQTAPAAQPAPAPQAASAPAPQPNGDSTFSDPTGPAYQPGSGPRTNA